MVDINFFTIEIVAVETGPAYHEDLFVEHLHFLCVFEFNGIFFLIAQKIKAWQIVTRKDQNVVCIDGGKREDLFSDGQVLGFVIREDW